jgi:hypothetical protein
MINTALIFYETDHVGGVEGEQHYVKFEPQQNLDLLIKSCHQKDTTQVFITQQQLEVLKAFLNQL